MQHILTVSAITHIYQLCEVIMLKWSFVLMPLKFSNQAALRKTSKLLLEGLNQ